MDATTEGDLLLGMFQDEFKKMHSDLIDKEVRLFHHLFHHLFATRLAKLEQFLQQRYEDFHSFEPEYNPLPSECLPNPRYQQQQQSSSLASDHEEECEVEENDNVDGFGSLGDEDDGQVIAPTHHADVQGTNGGRKLSSIWKYFRTVYGENRKILRNTCRRCGEDVSARRDRLARHVVMCKKDLQGRTTKRIAKFKSRNLIVKGHRHHLKMTATSKHLPKTSSIVHHDDYDDMSENAPQDCQSLKLLDSSTKNDPEGENMVDFNEGENCDEDQDNSIDYEVGNRTHTNNPSTSAHNRTLGKKSLGRHHGPIWNHYITVRDDEGTIRSNICKLCNEEVSSRADRMTRHFTKCCGDHKPNMSEESNTVQNDNRTSLSSSENPFLGNVIDFDDNEDSSNDMSFLQAQEKSKKVPGKKRDPIWKQYITVRDEGGKIQSNKCKLCDMEISARSDRMTNHFTKCSE